MARIIAKKDLASWLREVLKEHTIIAPTSVGELTLFRPITTPEEIALDFDNTVLSPKEWFFPRAESLFTQDGGGKEPVPQAIDKLVIFGIRPCDAKGLTVLDKALYGTPFDALYAQRRDQATLVGLACSKPGPQCFCTTMGSAPDDASNVDIMLTEVDDGYIVETVTKKGEELTAGAKLSESKSPPPQIASPAVIEGIAEAMPESVEEKYWSRLADRCLHCHICAFVCPTCYCTQAREYDSQGTVEQLRCWYSCQAQGFTRIAGNTPNPTKADRMRHRFYHKLPHFPDQLGSGYATCVGCGRCVTACPVNIDIREVIADTKQRQPV